MLVGNRSVLLKSPGRFLAGTVASGERSAFSMPGMLAGRFESFSKPSAAIPGGHLAPSAWALPRTAGGMSSANSATLALATTGQAVGGITTTAAALLTFTVADAAGQLISSGTGSATFTVSGSGNLLASLAAVGSASWAITTNTPTLGAEANLGGAASWAISGTLTPYAVGHMVGTTVESGALTASTLASAVWSQAIEAGFTAEQVLRILAAHAAGAATGLEGSNPRFTGLDGATVRIDGTYAAGTRTISALQGA